MITSVTECERCTGKGGAHFAFCFIAQAWEKVMGANFPWMPPVDDRVDAWQDGYEQGRADATEPPEEPDWVADWPGEYIPGPWDDDPPDYQGVAEDTTVAMGAPSDANWWGPHGMRIDPDESEKIHVQAAYTELAPGYLDTSIAEREATPSPRRYNTSGLAKAVRAKLQAQEDAAVQFVYDCCEFTPGGRVPLADLHVRFDEWRRVSDRPSMSKDRLRDLLVEVGVEVAPGRLPGMRTSGKAPLLACGVTLRPEDAPAEPRLPKITLPSKKKHHHALIGRKPGGELPKQLRDLIEPLITEQKWEYQPHNGSGKGKPRLIAPDGKTVTLPSTPHLQGRMLENTRSFLKQNGALL